MKISVITATYNSASTIADTLASIADQTYKNVEHIIVDGNSTDETLGIVNTFHHVTTVISEKDDGIYDAMNKGLVVATGEVIGILNSDDVYAHNGVLETVNKIFEEQNIDVCYADLEYVDQRNLNKVVRKWRSGKFNSRSFYWGWMPPHPTVFVRKKVYQQVGNFNTSLKSAADYELMLRIFVKNKFNIKYLPEFIVKMRVGGKSNASLKHRLLANREDKLAWQLNNLSPWFFTVFLKPIRKVPQFLIK